MINKSIILISLFLLISCNELSQSVQDTLTPSVQPATSPSKQKKAIQDEPIAASVDALQKAENSLRNLPQFKDKEIFVYRSAHFYDNGRIILNIQDPTDLTIVDKYTYKDGVWLAPEPVRITRSDQLENNLASLEKAPFAIANKVYESVYQKLKEINSDQSNPTVYFIAFKGSIRWYPSTLKTDRSSYSLKFDDKGNLLSFEQD